MLSQHPKHETAATQLQERIHTLEQWLTNNRIKFSTNKSSLTFITPHNTECITQPQVTLNKHAPPSHTQNQNPWSHIRQRDYVQTTYRRH